MGGKNTILSSPFRVSKGRHAVEAEISRATICIQAHPTRQGTTDAVGLFLARHYEATGLAIGVLTGLARNVSTQQARQAILPPLLSVFLVKFVIDLLAQLDGSLTAVGWSIVVLDLLFALTYGYFLFVKRAVAGGI